MSKVTSIKRTIFFAGYLIVFFFLANSKSLISSDSTKTAIANWRTRKTPSDYVWTADEDGEGKGKAEIQFAFPW